MNAPMYEYYPTRVPEVIVLFDVRIPGVAERLHRERAAWQEQGTVEALDEHRFVLIIRPGSALRLVP